MLTRSAGAAVTVDWLGRMERLQDLAGGSDPLSADPAGPVVEFPVGVGGTNPTDRRLLWAASVEKLQLGTGAACGCHVHHYARGLRQ